MRILAAAEDIFIHRGFQAASMDEIANKVGISKPLIYDEYGSKDGLVIACCQHTRGLIQEAILTGCAPYHEPGDILRHGLIAMYEFVRAHRKSWLLIRNAVVHLDGGSRPEIEQIRVEQERFVGKVMLDGLPNCTDLERKVIVQILLGANDRVAEWFDRETTLAATEVAEIQFNAIWSGIAHKYS